MNNNKKKKGLPSFIKALIVMAVLAIVITAVFIINTLSDKVQSLIF